MTNNYKIIYKTIQILKKKNLIVDLQIIKLTYMNNKKVVMILCSIHQNMKNMNRNCKILIVFNNFNHKFMINMY